MVKYSYLMKVGLTMTIGEKIKYLRKEKKITQASLCGDCVTRNMLSRIEHGAALPSIPTLKHLADALGVSAGYFLDDTDEKHPYQKLALWHKVRSAFLKKDYAACLVLTDPLDHDDEVAYVKAASLYALGHAAYQKGQLKTAEALLKEAEEIASLSLYAAPLVDAVSYDLELIAKIRVGKMPELSGEPGAAYSEEIDFYLYLYLLHVTKTTRYEIAAAIYDTMKFQNTLFRKHINARLSLLSRNSSRAATLLKELSDEIENTDCDPLFRLTVLTDRENVANTLGDYEDAYKTLLLKNTLLESFQL